MSEHHRTLGEIVTHFEALAVRIERAIEAFAPDDSDAIDLSALHRARDTAQRGARIIRNAMSGIRSAFD